MFGFICSVIELMLYETKNASQVKQDLLGQVSKTVEQDCHPYQGYKIGSKIGTKIGSIIGRLDPRLNQKSDPMPDLKLDPESDPKLDLKSDAKLDPKLDLIRIHGQESG